MGRVINSTRTYVHIPVHHVSPPPTAEFLLAQNSNIIQLFSMLKKDDKSQQVVYYQVCRSAFFLS